jgi:hypothetical protein
MGVEWVMQKQTAWGQKNKSPMLPYPVASGLQALSGAQTGRSGLVLGLQDLATTVEAIGADVVTQMGFTSGGFHGNARHIQGIVRTVHAALGRRLFVLLNSHDGSLITDAALKRVAQLLVERMTQR